jgi:hypothetical protein
VVAKWLNGEKMEDLTSTIADDLHKFNALKQKNLLKPEDKDIGKFKTARLFSAKIDTYTVPEDVNAERGKYKEIANTSEVRVIELLDEVAAKYYGRGTKWCTAAKSKNMFSQYFEDGPLYVVIPKNPLYIGEKYQIWWDKKKIYNFQLMNEKDVSVENINGLIDRLDLKPIFSKLSKFIIWKDNPSEQEQLTAVNQDGYAIQFIKNPSEAVQLAAVKQYGYAIRYIKNPSEAVQLAAVNQDGNAIKYIKNPSEQLQLAAVKQNGVAIQYIENPSEQLQLAAVKQNGVAIQYIENPSEQVQLAAVKQYAWLIQYIENPSEAVQLAAVKKNGYAIQYIKNPSEAVQLVAVK